MALTELSRFLPRNDYRNRFLRGSMRNHDADMHPDNSFDMAQGAHFELPPGATFDPDPHTHIAS
jgi:putative (di)nucleoside polyphosphate hydrolase